jgi:molybdate transport system ATP-binding protein
MATNMPFIPLLKLEKLSVRIRGKLVLKEIDWTIGRGEQWAVVGPNGSGKTSLVKTLAGMLPSAGGNVIFYPFNRDRNSHTPTSKDIGFVSAELHRKVFEREALVEDIRHFTGDDTKVLTVKDFILDRSEQDENLSPGSTARLETMGRNLDLEGIFPKKVGAMTTGEISKTLILKALLHQPQLLILDEPFNGLDRRSRNRVADFISGLIRKGLQVIMITHRIDEILPEISHVLMMTADGVQKKGYKNEVLQPAVFKRVYGIDHNPMTQETVLPRRPAGPVPHLNSGRGKHTVGNIKMVEMVDINVRYHNNTVLKNIQWTVQEGENWIVSGPDGAGKTSLLKLITGDNLQAYANNIILFGHAKGSGESVWDIKQKIGWVSSDLHSKYPPNIKGAEVVYSGFFDSVGLFRAATSEQKQQAEHWLSMLDIDHLAGENYGELSHGQRQMLLIARAIVKAPRLLLLDEPCEGLDLANRRKILKIIDFIGFQTPSTIVYATLEEEEALSCITHQLLLDRGLATISPNVSKQY